MKPQEIFLEAILAVSGRLVGSVVSVLALIVALGFPALIEGYVRSELDGRVAEDAASGAAVYLITSQDGALSSKSCEALSQQAGVVSVGSLFGTDIVHLAQAPGVPIQMARVSPGFLEVIAPLQTHRAPTVVAGYAIAEELGTRVGQHVTIRYADLHVPSKTEITATLGDSGRTADRGRWLFAVSRIEQDSVECWVEASVPERATVLETLSWRFGEEISVQSISRDGFEELERSWDSRPSRLLWLVGVALGAIVLGLGVFARRDEIALYRLSGAGRGATMLIVTLSEYVLATAALVAVSTAILAHILITGGSAATQVAVLTLAATFTATTALVQIAVFVAALGDLSRMVRNRG